MFFEEKQQNLNSVNVINCLARLTVSLALGEHRCIYLGADLPLFVLTLFLSFVIFIVVLK